uniref:Uncharacterized protein n=1 Tax=Trypanosoma congolense (strain IL3000) TaxID=1068625 RepID=G0UN98_TRYCI|nr:hypothetical protein, unlikely [Trypanosoma congolense IL3000]
MKDWETVVRTLNTRECGLTRLRSWESDGPFPSHTALVISLLHLSEEVWDRIMLHRIVRFAGFCIPIFLRLFTSLISRGNNIQTIIQSKRLPKRIGTASLFHCARCAMQHHFSCLSVSVTI